MKIFREKKDGVKGILIWFDAKLGGDSSTQSHATEWSNHPKE